MKDLQEMMILFSVIWFVIRGCNFLWKRKFSVKSEIVVAAVPFSLAFIYIATVFPFPFANPYANVDMGVEIKHNYVPFTSIIDSLQHFYYMVPLRNIGGNIVLFVPLGFALLLRFLYLKFWKGIMIGFLVSLFMEICQRMMGYRSFDADDLILNTVGTCLGMILFKTIVKFSQKETFSVTPRKIG